MMLRGVSAIVARQRPRVSLRGMSKHHGQPSPQSSHGNFQKPNQNQTNHRYPHPQSWHRDAFQANGPVTHSAKGFDLAAAALAEMHEAGFKPEFAPDVAPQVIDIAVKFAQPQPEDGVEDLR